MLMTVIDEIEVVPVKRILRKKHQFLSDGFSRAGIKSGKQFSEVTFPGIIKESSQTDEIPFEKWMMPPQPQAYLKYYGNDFL